MFSQAFIAATALASLASPSLATSTIGPAELTCPPDWRTSKAPNVHPDPNNVYKYFRCSENGPESFHCGKGTIFDAKLKFCSSTFLICPSKFKNSEYNAHQNVQNPSTYWMCDQNNGAALNWCPESQIFNSTLHYCVPKV